MRALFNRFEIRGYFAVIGISMHLGIALLLDMGPFSWISLAYYICLLKPREIEPWLTRLAFVRSNSSAA